jgi:hypothetical protein
VLFGQQMPADYFNDDNVGRVLDHLFNVGTQKIFSALSVSALQCFELSTHHVHFDTTSVSLYGDYRGADGEEAPFKITQGYSWCKGTWKIGWSADERPTLTVIRSPRTSSGIYESSYSAESCPVVLPAPFAMSADTNF